MISPLESPRQMGDVNLVRGKLLCRTKFSEFEEIKLQ